MKADEITLQEIKERLRESRPDLTKKFHVKEIGVFGSFVHGRAGARSDIDLLVEFDEGCKDFFNYIRLKYNLEEIFHRKVDLVTKGAIKPRLKERILGEVSYVYQAA
jgi:uncharacterized protein